MPMTEEKAKRFKEFAAKPFDNLSYFLDTKTLHGCSGFSGHPHVGHWAALL